MPLLAVVLSALLLAPLTAAAQTAGPAQPAATPAPAQSEQAHTITVKVALQNGAAGEKLPADLRLTDATVTLYTIAGGNPVDSREARPGADGSALFQDAQYQGGYGFGAVARVGLTTYMSELISPPTGASEVTVPVKVFATTTDASQVRISQAYLLAEAAGEGKLQISTLFILSNDGDKTVEGGAQDGNGNAASLAFPLPAGAQDAQFEQNDQVSFALTDGGFVVRPGIPPGEGSGRVGVRYTLPYTESLRLESRLPYPVDKLTVFVATPGITLTSRSLISLGAQRREDGVMMNVWGAEKIAANQSIAYELRGRPELPPAALSHPVTPVEAAPATLMERAARFFVEHDRIQLYGFGLITAGLLLALSAGGWWVYRTRFASNPAAQQERALLGALADLQEDHEAGLVEHEDYERRFAQLTEALSALSAPATQPEPDAA